MRPAPKIALAVLIAAVAAGGGYLWFTGTRPGDVATRFAALVGFGPRERPQRPPPAVVLTEVGTATVTRTVQAVGDTVAAESVVLTAEVPGRIVEIAFSDGERVEEGRVLVRLDQEIVRTELGNLEAEAKQVEQELERADYLLSRGSGPRATVDDTQRRLQAARARVQGAQERLNDTTVRAPFTGRVGLRDISIGAIVERTTRLVTLDTISPMDLRFSVPEQFLGQVKSGTRITAETSAFEGRRFEGSVRATASRVDPASRTITVEGRIENEDGALVPGMLMSVTAVLETIEKALVVPAMAVVARGSEQFVYRLAGDNKVERRPVRIGQREADRVQIVEGVEAGDRIVTEGVQGVTEGQAVRVIEPRSRDGNEARPNGAKG